MLRFFAARAIKGVEFVDDHAYRRLLVFDGCPVRVEVRADEARADALAVRVDTTDVAAIDFCRTRASRAFDLARDVTPIERHLRRDPLLSSAILNCPGLRPPGAWEAFELAIRAILGQQISVVAARQLAGQLVALCGRKIPGRVSTDPLSHLFPTAADLAGADLSTLGMPDARRRTLRAMARAVLDDPDCLQPTGGLLEAVTRLQAISGIGPWTAHYIALRAFREADAFPASDVALLRVAGDGQRLNARALLARAEAWRPWRAYAAQYLWSCPPMRSSGGSA